MRSQSSAKMTTDEPQSFALDLSTPKSEPTLRPGTASVAVQTEPPSPVPSQEIELELLIDVLTDQIEANPSAGAPEEEAIKPEDAIELDRAELSHECHDHPMPVIDLPEQSTIPDSQNAGLPSLPPALTLADSNMNIDVDLATTQTQAHSKSNSTAIGAKISDSRSAQTCQICGKVLAHISSLYRHHRLTHNKNQDIKGNRDKTGYLKRGLTMMTLDEDGKPTAPCNLCGESMSSLADLQQHKLTVHKLETPAYVYGSPVEN